LFLKEKKKHFLQKMSKSTTIRHQHEPGLARIKRHGPLNVYPFFPRVQGNADSSQRPPGTDVMIFKIFSPKNLAQKLAFLTQNKAKF
jgi:hypothetical protein